MIEAVSDSCPHGFKWISEIENATCVDDLDGSAYPELESRVSTAIKKSIKADAIFHQRISQMIEEGHKTGKRVKSRQIIYLMYQYLRPHVRGESLFAFKDILHCKLDAHPVKCTPDELESFLIHWDNVVSGMKNVPDSDMMYTLMLDQVENISALEFDMNIFQRLPENQKTYEGLRDVLNYWIRKTRGEKNQRKTHTKAQQHLAVAGAAPRAHTTSSERNRRHSRGRPHTRTPSRSRTHSKPRSTSSNTRKGKARRSSRDKPCMDFIKGKCSRGAGCKYSHGRDPKKDRSPIRTPSPVRRGSSPGGALRRTPVQNQKKPCHSFAATKTCKYGNNCAYSHTTPSAAATPTPGSERRTGDRSANSPAPDSFR